MGKNTRKIFIGNTPVGGGSPITIQSMTNTKTSDVKATVGQILELEREGCDIIRVAVPDKRAASCLADIKKGISIPLVADIHFDYRLAIAAIDAGADALRINPGNIGSTDRLARVVRAAAARGIPIRIGINGGSLEEDILEKYKAPCAEALVESALRNIRLIEGMNYYNMKLSLKASDVLTTIEAYRLVSRKVDYPLHVGVTEAGTFLSGTVKSSIGIGSLLIEGIGDTIRVSLTDRPVREVEVGREILKSLGLYRKASVDIISCPTCGRCGINLIELADRVADRVKDVKKPLKIAIMGCAVNGPGEAKEADIGIAGGSGKGIVFKKGKIIRTVREQDLLEALMEEIDKY
ncbi:MAG: flavodoxin-dependent (E)-4-hydroxy-3-methylbut-2-enyl-diphosphate synthase [Clostridiales bacterium]|jgi:(E)-4-hydroxy-3-methylbut-2-enyl-diphosphate synthase|nr:flavodoxin-dependent (E)-4-hydroxy-3-methylbut-2-enyl-diphosphate synthase [Clostridiales bacterium]